MNIAFIYRDDCISPESLNCAAKSRILNVSQLDYLKIGQTN